MGIGQELLNMKAEIEKHKKAKSESEGALSIMNTRLFDEYEMNSYDEACDYADALEDEHKENEVKLKDAMKNLREKFDV